MPATVVRTLFVLVSVTIPRCDSAMVAVGSPSTDALTMTATPSAVLDGVTKELTVNCSFSPQQTSDFATVLSLILSKAGNSLEEHEVAAITSLSRDSVVVKDSLGGHVTGSLPADGSGYLSVYWTNPGVKAIGAYSCHMHGMDQFGHTLVISASTEVNEVTVDNEVLQEVLLEKIKALQTQLNDQKKEADDTKSKLEDVQRELNHTKTTLKTTTSDLQVQIDDQKSNLEDQTSQLTSLLGRIDDSMSAVMEASTTYRGHTYYLSRMMWNTITVYDSLCRLYGGYLAEVDDKQEMEFLQSFMKNNSAHEPVFIGGTEEGHVGKWTYRRSGEPVKFIDWSPGQPDVAGHMCLGLWSVGPQHTEMADNPCFYQRWMTFMCEVPQ